MRSIYRRFALWFSGCFLLAIAGVGVIGVLTTRGLPGNTGMEAFLEMQLMVARQAYAQGGKEQLRNALAELDRMGGNHRLLDRERRDLMTGMGVAADNLSSRRSAVYSEGGYTLLVGEVPRPGNSSTLLLYFALLLAIILGLSLILALSIARPLLSMCEAVSRFGAGDFSVRLRSRRIDEIGQVARAFDAMADRIEALLNAERRLIQDVAHEIRTPLARLTLAIDLYKDSPDREVATGQLKREARRLTALMNELLQIIAAESDPGEKVTEEVDIAELVADVIDDCRVEMGSRHESMAFAKGEKILPIRGDRELLRRAIENVMRNAMRYTPEGAGVATEISSGADVLITIRDFGPGVPESQLDLMFQPFYRVEKDRGRESGGSGLGLSIAQRAVALHNGQIWAENADPGLRVHIRLPANN